MQMVQSDTHTPTSATRSTTRLHSCTVMTLQATWTRLESKKKESWNEGDRPHLHTMHPGPRVPIPIQGSYSNWTAPTSWDNGRWNRDAHIEEAARATPFPQHAPADAPTVPPVVLASAAASEAPARRVRRVPFKNESPQTYVCAHFSGNGLLGGVGTV